MPRIAVTTVIQTIYDVPEGVSIDRIRQLALPDLSEAEDETSEVMRLHEKALTQVYYGAQECLRQSVEHGITEE